MENAKMELQKCLDCGVPRQPEKNGYSQMDKERIEQSVEPCLYSPRDPQASGYMYTKIGQTGGDRRRTLERGYSRRERVKGNMSRA